MSKKINLEVGEFNVNEEDIDPETGRFKGDNDKIRLDNDKDFELLLIKHNNIEKLDWADPKYLETILNSDYIETIKFSPNSFAEDLGKALEIENYEFCDVKCNLFYEEPNYHYEILYIDLLPVFKKKK